MLAREYVDLFELGIETRLSLRFSLRRRCWEEGEGECGDSVVDDGFIIVLFECLVGCCCGGGGGCLLEFDQVRSTS